MSRKAHLRLFFSVLTDWCSVTRKQGPLWMKQAWEQAWAWGKQARRAPLTRAVGWRLTSTCVCSVTLRAQALLRPRALQDARSGEPLVVPAGALTRHSLLYATPVTMRHRGLTPPRGFTQALLPAWQQCRFSSTFLLRRSLRWLSRTSLKRQGWGREVNKHEVMMWFF